MKKGNPVPDYRDLRDPPVPRAALKKRGGGSFSKGSLPLPEVLPAGIMPPEDSRLWLFVPKAVQKGQEFIQDDTRDWFEERDRKVAIAREYPDHPRWLSGAAKKSMRGALFNGNIVSEVHMLARLNAGLAEYPAWVPVKQSLKQAQSEVAYRLTALTRKVLMEKGKVAMETFADLAPNQFIKFVGSTFVTKKVESEIPTPTAGTLDVHTADKLIDALTAELKRREQEMKIITLQGGGDYHEVAPAQGVQSALDELNSVLARHKKPTAQTAETVPQKEEEL